MKFSPFFLLAALAAPVSAAPVHVALKRAVSVTPNTDGFFTLGSVADLTGGDPALRTRLASVPVGRAPLIGDSRRLTLGDLALKLRQAGCDPDKDAVLEGAGEVQVTTGGGPPVPNNGGVRASAPTNPAPPLLGAGGVSLLHPGSPVTILIQTGALTITAPGEARESGGAGDSIRVHRDGVMTDLTVTVLDAQTVRLEI